MGLLVDIDRSLGTAVLEKQPSRTWSDMRIGYGETVPHGERTRDLIGSYRAHTWLNVAVKVIANSVADVPLVVLKSKPKSDRPGRRPRSLISYKQAHPDIEYAELRDAFVKSEDGEVVDSHWALDLMEEPLLSAGITRHEFLQAIVTYLETCGNAYVEKVFTGKNKENVKELWPRIDPRYMWVIPGTEKLVEGYLFRYSGKPITFEADEIIHFTYFHPENAYYGLAPAEVVKNALIADLRALEWNRLFFENNAVPEVYGISEQALSESDVRFFEKQMRERFGGRRSRGFGLFGRGITLKELTRTHKDMDFLNLRKWTRDEVLAVYGVPPIYAGVREGGNRAISAVERRIFWENTILPRLGKIEDRLNIALLAEENVRLCFDISAIEALQEDEEKKAKILATRARAGIRPNDILEAYGEEPIEDEVHNTLYMPQTLVPIAAPADEGDSEEEEDEEEAEKAVKTVKADEPILAGDPDGYLAPVNTRTAEAVRLAHMPALAVAGGGRGANLVTALGGTVPDDWEHVYNFQGAIERWLDEKVAWETGEVEPRLAHWIRETEGVTRDRARTVIRQGIRDGKGARGVAKALRDEFKGMSQARAMTIARTEGGAAVSFGQHHLYEATGVDEHWWLAQMVDTRDSHQRAHAKYPRDAAIPITEEFTFAGMDGPVSTIAPRLTGIAAEDINCYCEDMPKLKGEKAWKSYEEIGVKRFDVWMKSVEEQGEGRRFQDALARYFLEEGERYAEHLLRVAGDE